MISLNDLDWIKDRDIIDTARALLGAWTNADSDGVQNLFDIDVKIISENEKLQLLIAALCAVSASVVLPLSQMVGLPIHAVFEELSTAMDIFLEDNAA